MPIIKTKGAASSQGFGEFTVTTPPVVNYIEDVFSTYLYKGNGSTQTVTNGIDLAGNGGLVWIKNRTAAFGNRIYSNGLTASGYFLYTNSTNAQANSGNALTYASNGWSIVSGNNDSNDSIYNYVSWTFRKQAKFFDIVTYTGNGTSQDIAHSLGSIPGCIIVKNISSANGWQTWHRGLTSGYRILLNSDAGQTNAAIANVFGNNSTYVAPTSTQFTVGSEGAVNQSGETMVAYIFAHNAGGFGLTGTDNVISCGSYTGNGSTTGPVVTLGYEPQWILIKKVSGGTSIASSSWVIFDTMRGIATISSGSNPVLYPNLADAEDGQGAAVFVNVSATGFNMVGPFDLTNASSSDYIYIAIRRGPMKVPTLGTTVFEPVTATSVNADVGTLQASDMGWFKDRTTTANWFVADRLRGIMSYYNPTLYTNVTDAEATPTTGDTVTAQSSLTSGNGIIYFGGAGTTGDQPLGYSFKRAPSFFDEVCYAGTSTNRYQQHSLTVVPELIFVKCRNSASTGWITYSAATGPTKYMKLNNTDAATTDPTFWNDLSPTSTTFSLGLSAEVNSNSVNQTYVAYLFATCAGVSKVGSFTGTGLLQTIDCGFTAGSRFVLIKRTSASGEWYVWDSARGITSGNDPYLFMNSTAAETTGTNFVDTTSVGFQVTAAATGTVNISGQSYIFLAIA